MGVLKISRVAALAAFTCAFSAPDDARAVDFEKKLQYDKACIVKAFSGEGDVYLECKDTPNVLKTTVELPDMIAALQTPASDVKKQVEIGKKVARVKMVWGILDFSFINQIHILITFNSDKTLIDNAVAYVNPEFEQRIRNKAKMDL